MAIVFPRPGQYVNGFDLPTPPEWHAAMLRAGRSLSVPGLMRVVWPETPETSEP